jgi:hypothetical protein
MQFRKRFSDGWAGSKAATTSILELLDMQTLPAFRESDLDRLSGVRLSDLQEL